MSDSVLSDPNTRAIYDTYGQKGLEAGWEVVERKRTPAEIREEYERLRREQEERRLQQITNPKGSITVKIDATDLFEPYDDLYYDMEESWFPNVEIRGMSIQQSVEAPLTRKDTAVLSGSLNVHKGNGTGNVGVSVRRIISTRAWGEVQVGAGDGPTLQVKGFRNITKKMFGTVSLNAHLRQSALLTAGLQAMVARQLGKHTTGYLAWNGGLQSSMTATIVKSTEKYHLLGTIQLSTMNTFGVLSYQHKFGTETRVKATLKFGLVFGPILEYGCDRQITNHSRLGASVTVGTSTGVSLKIKLHRYTQTYSFPIILSESIIPSAVFYGTITPLIAYWAFKLLLIKPFIEKEKERDLESQREKHSQQMAERKREAEANIRLMQETYKRSIDSERNRHVVSNPDFTSRKESSPVPEKTTGLIIVNAWYGKLVSTDRPNSRLPAVIDVTVPLQCLVKDSKLILTEATKSHLNGFYDPCMGEDKSLKVVYEFRDDLHEVLIQDDQPLRIPKQSHRIPQT